MKSLTAIQQDLRFTYLPLKSSRREENAKKETATGLDAGNPEANQWPREILLSSVDPTIVTGSIPLKTRS